MSADEETPPSHRHIVALLGPDNQSAVTLHFAVKAAQRLNAGLTAVFVSPNSHARAVGATLQLQFQNDTGNSSVAGDWQVLDIVQGANGFDMSPVWAATGMADFVIVSHESAQSLLASNRVSEVPYHLVRECGRPVVFLPPANPEAGPGGANGAAEPFAVRVIIAWDGGREATRAVQDALPLLALADDVIVLSVDSDRDIETTIGGSREIAKYLTAHGISVRLHQTYVAHGDVGRTILSRASEARSDLVVMGACAHPHILDVSLGGATRYVLENMSVPVLMSC